MSHCAVDGDRRRYAGVGVGEVAGTIGCAGGTDDVALSVSVTVAAPTVVAGAGAAVVAVAAVGVLSCVGVSLPVLVKRKIRRSIWTKGANSTFQRLDM